MTDPSHHDRHMRRCLELARQAIASGDAPVGSLILDGDALVSEGVEAVRARHDATAHAEMEALRTAFVRRRSRDLTGCTLYTSVEPCIMCAYAIRLARISVVVCGARGGDEGHAVSGYVVLTDERVAPNHPPPLVIRDVLAQECRRVRRYTPRSNDAMDNTRVFKMTFASVYPHYIAKAEKKGRTKEEVHAIIHWLTGYDEQTLRQQIDKKVDFETFFARAPRINPNVSKITGVICGYRVEEIADPLMQRIRFLDKLVDELAKGKALDKILRT